MKISLNLASRPFADQGPILRQLRVGMAVLAVLSGTFWLGLHLLHGSAEAARQRNAQLDTQIARITGERQGYQSLMRQPENQRLVAETSALNDLFELKAFSWTLAMENLETVLPGGVQMLTLEPAREKDGSITVHLRVAGPRDRVEELVRALEHSKRFALPKIVGESAEQATNQQQRLEPVTPQSRFNFDILAVYVPPTPEEMKARHGTAKIEPSNAQMKKPQAAKNTKTAGGAR